MKRVLAIAAVVEMLFVVLLLHSDIKDFLSAHPWWLGILAALPGIAVPVLAWFELGHSAEANTLRAEANGLRSEANHLQNRIGEITAELDAERNKHLGQIAENTKRQVTQDEKNAETLRKHLRATVRVRFSDDSGPGTDQLEIVEISDDNIVTLFNPFGNSASRAWCVKVRSGDLEIVDIPQGAYPLQLRVLKRYGDGVVLGEITRWEDRLQPAATPTFAKGDAAYYVTFVKPGSPEKRSLFVFSSRDGANSFLLEASTGEKFFGDNLEISKRFMMMQVEYQAAGFTRSTAGTGSSPYRLYVWSV